MQRAKQDHGMSDDASWGLASWDLQCHDRAIYRGLLPKGLTACLAVAGVPPDDQMDVEMV